MMKSKKIVILLLALFFILGIEDKINADNNQRNNASTRTIITANSISELVTAFNNANNGDTIALTNNFKNDISVSSIGVVLATSDSRNITIDGNNISLESSVLIADLFTLTNNGTGKITFKNFTTKDIKGNVFTIKGTGVTVFDNINTDGTIKSGIRNESSGTLEVENSSFENGKASAYYEAVSSAHIAKINNTLFANNSITVGSGAAMSFSSNANATVTNSSFKENSTGATGYVGGAVATQSEASNITLKISKSYFYKNTITNNVGGAIGIYHLKGGSITIDESVFESNESLGTSNTADAGAIGIKNNSTAYTGSIVVSNNYFLKNVAADNGGAMLIEATNEGVTTANVYNNTFVQNLAECKGSSGNVGGAIQTYGGPTSTLSHNTFYQNKVLTSGGGGAVGISGPNFSASSAKVANNIFVDNYAPDLSAGNKGKKENVATKLSVSANVNNNGNVGYDNGSVFIPDNASRNALVKLENIFVSFYKASDTLPDYASVGDAKAINVAEVGATGNKGTSRAYIPSPRIDEMLRTNDPRTITGVLEDVRSYPREKLTPENPYYPNAGAVEIYWTKFDPGLAAGGNWSSRFNVESEGGIESLAYPGIFYKINNPPRIDSGGVATYEENLTFTRNTLTGPAEHGFTGWQNTSLVTELKDVNEVYTARKQTYVAQWTRNVFHVDFDLKGGSAISGHDNDFNTQIINNGVNNNLATQPNSIPIKPGYVFVGWYDDDSFTGLQWNFSTNQVFADVTLYAKWEKKNVEKYIIKFDMQGHGKQIPSQTVNDGEKAIKPKDPAEKGYIFKGWYTTKVSSASNINKQVSEKKYNFETPVNKNITVYAKWEKEKNKLPSGGAESNFIATAMLLITGVVLLGTLRKYKK